MSIDGNDQLDLVMVPALTFLGGMVSNLFFTNGIDGKRIRWR